MRWDEVIEKVGMPNFEHKKWVYDENDYSFEIHWDGKENESIVKSINKILIVNNSPYERTYA